MKGNAEVIQILNEVLTWELTSVNQYFLGSKICANWGYLRLHAYLRKESIDEMKHADVLIERVLFLEGLPNVQKLEKIQIADSVPGQLAADKQLEDHAIARLNKGIARCRELADVGSAELLEHILVSEEAHLDWIETQLTLIQQIGEAHYLAQQARE